MEKYIFLRITLFGHHRPNWAVGEELSVYKGRFMDL